MIKIPKNQEYVLNTLSKNGYEAYIVGGCVRDSLLGKTPDDYDVTTNATPDVIQSLFPKTVPTGIAHGTVTVIVEKEPIEVTTFRSESGYSDSRHPDVTKFETDIKYDLSRRDFTVNAMAYNNKKGLVDLYGGRKDLENKILRAVGEPEKRFGEDALRILRLFRFAAKLGFSVEDNTRKAAIKLKDGLKKISRERIFTELYKTVSAEKPSALLPLLRAGGLEFLGVKNQVDFEKIKSCQTNPDLAFFAFGYTATDNIKEFLSELKVSNKLKNYCLTLERLSSLPIPKSRADIKEMLNISSPDIFSDYSVFVRQGNLADEAKDIIIKNEPYRISDLKINGEQLKKIGIKGIKIGESLELMRKYVIINPEKNNEKDLTDYLLSGILLKEGCGKYV